MSTSTLTVSRSKSQFLASLPWLTDSVITNPSLVPAVLNQDFQVSLIVLLSSICRLIKTQEFINSVLDEEKKLIANEHEKTEFNRYYLSMMGYGGKRKSYSENKNRMHFSGLTNMLMKYRLCDIITWTFCGDESGPVPLHEKRVFKVLSRTVSILYINDIHPDFFLKTFHKMKSIKAVLDNAHRHFGTMQGSVSKPGAQAKHDARLSDGLNRIWGKYHLYSQTATKAIIAQSVMLVAYHI